MPRSATSILSESVWPALAAAALCALAACTGSEWPSRPAVVVNDVAVDSLKRAFGGRYALIDTAIPLRIAGFRKGYACSRILEIGLVKTSVAGLAGYRPKLSLQLPEGADCALDSAKRDSVLQVAFDARGDSVLRLFNTGSELTDSAILARGLISADSFDYVPMPLGFINRGRWFYRDSSAQAGRLLAAPDSLSACEAINHAEFSKHGDTTKVRFTWVTFERPASECAGPKHLDSIAVIRGGD